MSEPKDIYKKSKNLSVESYPIPRDAIHINPNDGIDLGLFEKNNDVVLFFQLDHFEAEEQEIKEEVKQDSKDEKKENNNKVNNNDKLKSKVVLSSKEKDTLKEKEENKEKIEISSPFKLQILNEVPNNVIKLNPRLWNRLGKPRTVQLMRNNKRIIILPS